MQAYRRLWNAAHFLEGGWSIDPLHVQFVKASREQGRRLWVELVLHVSCCFEHKVSQTVDELWRGTTCDSNKHASRRGERINFYSRKNWRNTQLARAHTRNLFKCRWDNLFTHGCASMLMMSTRPWVMLQLKKRTQQRPSRWWVIQQ